MTVGVVYWEPGVASGPPCPTSLWLIPQSFQRFCVSFHISHSVVLIQCHFSIDSALCRLQHQGRAKWGASIRWDAMIDHLSSQPGVKRWKSPALCNSQVGKRWCHYPGKLKWILILLIACFVHFDWMQITATPFLKVSNAWHYFMYWYYTFPPLHKNNPLIFFCKLSNNLQKSISVAVWVGQKCSGAQ